MAPKEAVAEAFAEHRARVEAAAARILRDRDEARDIAADTFIAMLEKGPRHERAVLPWLLTAARNRARNRVRSKIRAERRARLVAANEQVDAQLPYDGNIGALVREAGERLSARDRAAVALRHVEGRSYGEIAVALGTSASQSRVIVHRASQRMRREVVRIVAERHDVPAGCARELLRLEGRAAPHADCTPCTAVLDEVHAMTASGLLPVSAIHAVHTLERIVSRLSVSRPLRGSLLPGMERAGEAVAALALTMAMAVTPAAARAGGSEHSGEVARTDLATSLALPGTAAPAIETQAPAETPRRVGFAERADALREHGKRTLLEVPLIVARVVVPDPMSSAYDPSIDIKNLEALTMVDERGRFEGVVLRMSMAAEPRDDASYRLGWRFTAGDDCSGSMTLREGTGDVSLVCNSPYGVLFSDVHRQRITVDDAVQGSTIEIPIVRAELDREFRGLLGPGRVLENIRGETSRSSGLFEYSSDQAPEYGETFRYEMAGT